MGLFIAPHLRPERFGVSVTQRVYYGPVGTDGTFTPADAVVYSVYCGRARGSDALQYVRGMVRTGASGATTTTEIGIGTTPSGPNAASQTLTVVAATATVSGLTATPGFMFNTSAFTYRPTPGTHLWAMFRTLYSTKPVVFGVAIDMGSGNILTTAAGAALAAGNTYVGAVPAAAIGTIGPNLRITLD
jgi:hypothetical protein